MSDRGMKKWAPYKSLIEQDDFMKNMRVQKKRIQKPKVCEEKAQEINDLLVNYDGQVIVMEYFVDGFIEKIEGIIRYISNEFKCLYIDCTRYEFKNIVGLKKKSEAR
ncbi:MAG: YolD-like family protein [Bacilli bacterium]|nr:YolD-like family protein [Bacilli bacterium]